MLLNEKTRMLRVSSPTLYYSPFTIYYSPIMTPDEFRKIALSFPDTEERSHMGHPDFRVSGKIFATLGADETWGMAKLTPTQQQDYLRLAPAFKPASGKWGDGGGTIITLADADEADVRNALNSAWRNTAPKNLQD
jgi:hypothetical protein